VIRSYQAYGLNCLSNFPIPGLCPDSIRARPDLIFSIEPTEPVWISQLRNSTSSECKTKHSPFGSVDLRRRIGSLGSEEFFELAYSDGARFFIDGSGAKVWVYSMVPLPIDYLATYLRGPVMGFVLRRRGTLALHGSAVSIRGQAVVFCGPPEAGKSTLAAALSRRGIPVLTDDIAALGLMNGRFYVHPGYPWVCLWPDAARSLAGDPDELRQITATWAKHYLPLDAKTFESTPQPVCAIYLLASRSCQATAPRLEAVSPQEAVLDLVKTTYMNWLLDREQRAAEFDVLSSLVAHVDVKRVVPHTDPMKVGQLCQLITADLERTTPAAELASSDH
jgi:hypothetical protein